MRRVSLRLVRRNVFVGAYLGKTQIQVAVLPCVCLVVERKPRRERGPEFQGPPLGALGVTQR